MTHDYKAALEWFNSANWNERVPEIHAIRHALLIADRVMGEPSAAMCCIPYSDDTAYETWIAMRDQLIKEVTE